MTTLLIPDTDQAVDFLVKLFPNGPFHLASILEGQSLNAKSFDGDETDALRTWIDDRQGEANLYFHVNELRADFRDGKAKKEDVRRAHFIHVDIDDVGALEAIRAFSPRPTVVVNSGGGFQAFWRLSEPDIDLERVERINLSVANELGGDNCHNIDRIMRLPGTINVLNKKKRAAGRKPALAYIVDDLTDWSRAYPLDTFVELPPNPSAPAGGAIAVTDIPAHVELDSLPTSILPLTRTLIECGDDPDAPRGSAKPRYASRSEAVFRVACDLLKAGCTPDTVVSILLDPAYRISESVREKKNAKRYALRQVQSANEAVSVGWPDPDKSGRPRSTYRNTVVALRRLGFTGENDQFHHRKSINGTIMQVFQDDLSDDLCAMLRAAIIEEFQFDPFKVNVLDAANFVCLENSHHPIRDYLDQLSWDGVPRLETWLVDYLSAEDTPLNREISKIVMVAAVRRVREPGVKFDNVLVLEGAQGTGKSTAIRILAGDSNFSDQDILTLDAKQQMEALEGIWIYEISELSGLNRGETNKVKAFASRQVDRGRPAYGRFRENRARQTIFIGTTNEDQYLRDTTGNRRFWPVKTGQIDAERLGSDRDQLWAEAAKADQDRASISLPSNLWDVAAVEQETRMEDHPWQETLGEIVGIVSNGKARVTTDAVFLSLGIEVERRQQFHQKQLATMMRKLGWAGPKKLKIDGKTPRGYERDSDLPDTPPKQTF